ncbi:MAG: hypothetical protein KDB90_07905 [Planctomycetes bacterium]|nr:hypothetical protein [Planctomycetota bacterium]
MSRRTNVRKLKPRNKAIMLETISSTQRIYQETGGADIDFAIEAARQAYEIALHRAKRYIPPENGRRRDPLSEVNKAVRELRMLIQQREKKLAQCRRDIDETGEADGQEHTEEKAEQMQPDDGSPVLSDVPVESTDEPTPEQQHDQASR